MRLADSITRVIRQLIRDETADHYSGTVDAVNGDGTIDVLVDTAVQPSVRCMAQYAPQVGDVVTVHRDSRGNRITYGPAVAAGDGWVPFNLSGTWVHNGGATDPIPSARIKADGGFELSGMIKGTAVGVGTTSTLGTLPAAVRPALWCRGAIVTSLGVGTAVVVVNPGTGVVSLVNGGTAATATTWFQIDISGRGR